MAGIFLLLVLDYFNETLLPPKAKDWSRIGPMVESFLPHWRIIEEEEELYLDSSQSTSNQIELSQEPTQL